MAKVPLLVALASMTALLPAGAADPLDHGCVGNGLLLDLIAVDTQTGHYVAHGPNPFVRVGALVGAFDVAVEIVNETGDCEEWCSGTAAMLATFECSAAGWAAAYVHVGGSGLYYVRNH